MELQWEDYQVELLKTLLLALCGMVTAVVPWLVKAVVSKLQATTKIQLSEAEQAWLANKLVEADKHAEEQAHKLKKGDGQVELAGPKKPDTAKAFLTAELVRHNRPAIAQEATERLIEAYLRDAQQTSLVAPSVMPPNRLSPPSVSTRVR